MNEKENKEFKSFSQLCYETLMEEPILEELCKDKKYEAFCKIGKDKE